MHPLSQSFKRAASMKLPVLLAVWLSHSIAINCARGVQIVLLELTKTIYAVKQYIPYRDYSSVEDGIVRLKKIKLNCRSLTLESNVQ